MLRSKPIRFFTVLSISVWASACSNLQPTFKNPNLTAQALQKIVPKSWQVTTQASAKKLFLANDNHSLLNLFEQPDLSKLIEIALTNNIDLQRSALRLKIAHLQGDNSASKARPSTDITLNSSKFENANNTLGLAFNLNWELDVWGRMSDISLADKSEYQALTLDYQSAQTSLAARLVQQWNKLQSQWQVIAVEKRRIESLVNTEFIIKQRYREGLGTLADLKAAQAASARSKADLDQRQQLASQTLRQINLLLGRSPQHSIKVIATELAISEPNVATPLSVMRARPDIRAALQRIKVTDKKHSAAQKALLPNFTLSAGLNADGSNLSDLLSASSLWKLLANISAPLYQGGRLRNDIAIAEYEYEISYLDYQQLLYKAVEEVDTRLNKEQSLNRQQQYLKIAQRRLKESLQEYRQRYSDGLVDVLDLLNAQQNYFNSRIQLIELRRSRLDNLIDLGLALGLGLQKYTCENCSPSLGKDI